MQVDIINDIHHFDEVKPAWDAVYTADPNATTFVSWAWLRGWIETTTCPWLVLCVRPNNSSHHVAFLPLLLQTLNINGSYSVRVFRMWGNPAADHTGFICLPEYEEKAMPSLALHLQDRMKWDRLDMHEVFDHRLDFFLKHFSHKKFSIDELKRTPCPYITLPETWDQYLLNFLSIKKRRNIRRALKRVKTHTDFHLTTLQDSDLDSQVQVVRMLWMSRLGSPIHDLDKFAHVYKRCFEDRSLWIDIFWDDEKPIAGLIAFLDQQKRFYAYSIGYDSNYSKLSPGTAMMAYSIQYAIQNGYREYDFGRGHVDYKLAAFGAIERSNRNLIVTRKSLRMTARSLKPTMTRLLKSYSRIYHHI